MYDVAAIEAAFAQSMYSGKLHYTAVTGSTNTDALAAARAGAPHGSVFFADEQTAGRGRGDHGWQSAAGEGLYVSRCPASQHRRARLAADSAGRGIGGGAGDRHRCSARS